MIIHVWQIADSYAKGRMGLAEATSRMLTFVAASKPERLNQLMRELAERLKP